MTASAVWEQIDQIRADLAARKISRSEALAAVKAVARLTDVGAADVLDAPTSPAERFAATD